jgi:hypothetical protein
MALLLSVALFGVSALFAHAQTDTTAGQTTEELATASDPTNTNTGSATDSDTNTQTTDPGESADDDLANTGGTEETGTDTATIDTGDADANTDLSRETNVNDTTVVGADQTTVTNVNDGTIDNDADVLATTGDNTGVASDVVTITTGTARSTANILNVLNTNLFNAEGLFYFLNVLMGNIALDMRNLFSVLMGGLPDLGGGSTCDLSEGSCNSADTTLTIDNTNTGTVSTDVTVGASTAANTGIAEDGSADIATGDAYAGANVMNIVNTNITNANYLLLTMNAFGGGVSDIIFPGADWFYELLRGGSGVPAGSSITFENDNTANVTTDGTIEANSGDNSASAPEASIDTGNADASTNIVNRINNNIFGDSISLLFRVSDTWSGKIFGLPDGMSWRQTPAGIEIFLDDTLSADDLSDSAEPLNLVNRNTNVANVDTTFNVFALTGDNMAEGGEEASITTGDAEAGANVLNVVNTNVLGRNWVLAIFNILGDWDGDISFGQPDLWVGVRALTPSHIRGGTCFNYEFTVNNFGDATAREVYLSARYDRALQSIEDLEDTAHDRLAYHIGRIAKNQSRTFTLPACLQSGVPRNTPIETIFEVTAEEPDADLINNTDAISVVTSAGGSGGRLLNPSSVSTDGDETVDLTVTKTASETKITASSTVEYTITIENNGPQINYALLVDTISDPSGKPIHEERWGLEQIYADETIVLTYTATYNDETKPGTYTNTARVSGTIAETTEGEPIDSPVASAKVKVLDTVANTLATCEPLLTSYIRYGELNYTSDVRKLQHFLRTTEGAAGVPLSGEYDRTTHDAVHAFQTKYASDILIPWGVTRSTGYVYYTTQKKINEIWCLRDFPLTDEQRAEIEAFKARVNAQNEGGTPVPAEDFELIGMAPATKPETEMTELALSETEPARTEEPEEDRVSEAANQVAAVAEATAEAAGLWTSIKESVSGLFSKWW